jgi:hypothetical protein
VECGECSVKRYEAAKIPKNIHNKAINDAIEALQKLLKP